VKALKASTLEVRKHFRSNKDLQDPQEIAAAVQAAKEAADYLLNSVLQLRKEQAGKYKLQIKQHQTFEDKVPR